MLLPTWPGPHRATAQNSRHSQKATITGTDGQPSFNDRPNYCADCTQAKSMEMLAMDRCATPIT